MDSCPEWHAAPLEAGAPTAVLSLARLHKGARGHVSGVTGTDESLPFDEAEAALARRLLELGFVPGERIEVIGEVRPGGDPLAVRIGSTIFALRRREASAVQVQLERV